MEALRLDGYPKIKVKNELEGLEDELRDFTAKSGLNSGKWSAWTKLKDENFILKDDLKQAITNKEIIQKNLRSCEKEIDCLKSTEKVIRKDYDK